MARSILPIALGLVLAACACTAPIAGDGAPAATGPTGATGDLGIDVAAAPDGLEGSGEEEVAPVKLGLTDPQSTVHFSVVLHVPGATAMQRYARDVNDPTSADYRKFLSAADIGARFGLDDGSVERVERWLRSAGLDVVRHPQRTTLAVSGTTARVNQLFAVALQDYRDGDGRRYRQPDGEPRIPADLRDAVVGITGLDTSEAARPSLAPILGAVREGGMRPEDVLRAYDIEPLRAAGINGEGQTIAILSFDTFDPADVAAWDEAVGVTGPPVEKVSVAGGVAEPGSGAVEVNLDIDIVRGIAPAAQILNYEAPNGAGFAPIFDQIVADGRTDIVSVSWGRCEIDTVAFAREAADRSIEAAMAAGISIFVASGDAGAYDCRHQNREDTRISPDYPTANPNVIGVGGTYLRLREDGTYLAEAGWEEPFGGGGSGGGPAINYDRPPWQTGVPGLDQTTQRRQTPDVAGPADCDSAFFVVATSNGEQQQGPLGCGTSAAAPFFSASMLLIRQLAEREGVLPEGRGLGFVGPMLYELAAANQGAIFNDIVRGGNLLHNATPGWDYATGLGTPKVNALAQAVVEYLRQRPPG